MVFISLKVRLLEYLKLEQHEHIKNTYVLKLQCFKNRDK